MELGGFGVEKVLYQGYVVGNEWTSDIPPAASGHAPWNQRGMAVNLYRGHEVLTQGGGGILPGARVCIGNAGIGDAGLSYLFCIGVLDTDLWFYTILTNPTPPGITSTNQITNIWIVATVYGYQDRIILRTGVKSDDAFFAPSSTSGAFATLSRFGITSTPALSGIAAITVTTTPATLQLDLSGRDNYTNNGKITWGASVGGTQMVPSATESGIQANQEVNTGTPLYNSRIAGILMPDPATDSQGKDIMLNSRGFTNLLGDTGFGGQTKWQTLGDFAPPAGTCVYTDTALGTGELIQTWRDIPQAAKEYSAAGIRQTMLLAGPTNYTLTYNVSGSAGFLGTVDLQIAKTGANQVLTIADGAQTVTYAQLVPSNTFQISAVSTAGGFTLDNMFLRRQNWPFTLAGQFFYSNTEDATLVYTHGGGGTGTLTQQSADFEIPFLPLTQYVLRYKLIGAIAGTAMTLTGLTAAPVTCPVTTATLHRVIFTTSATPGNFVLNVTSSAGGWSMQDLQVTRFTADGSNDTTYVTERFVPGGYGNGKGFVMMMGY